MATVNIGDVLQIIQTWATPLASVAQNVWHLEMKTGAGADSSAIMAAVETQQNVAFADIQDEINDEFSIILYEMRRWDFALNRFDGLESLVPSTMVGISTTDYEPHGVAALGRIITAASRRQGRHFIPGMTHAQVESGILITAMEASLAAYLADFVVDIGVSGAVLAWCTFNVDPLSPVFETTSQATGTVIANSLPSYLSKRKPGVGL